MERLMASSHQENSKVDVRIPESDLHTWIVASAIIVISTMFCAAVQLGFL